MRKRPLIIFDDGHKQGKSGQANIGRQNLLLRGMLMTGDMDAARKYAGIHSAAEIIRTMDRISLRKDYHEALESEGVDMRWIVRGIKDKAENAELDSVRLAALRMFLTSLGLNNYSVAEEGTKNWEETLLELAERYQSTKMPALEVTSYEVLTPPVPESAKGERKKEDDLGKELYDKR